MSLVKAAGMFWSSEHPLKVMTLGGHHQPLRRTSRLPDAPTYRTVTHVHDSLWKESPLSNPAPNHTMDLISLFRREPNSLFETVQNSLLI